tara:strand:- start:353 stop:1891 length:1539 start_codon:yes stop_codon:yes gene_type:complete
MDTNVMFTDMVGYSKLTGDDQNLALELLKEHDKIIEPIIAKYKGSIVKRIGDAIVAIFDDSEDIIQSAVEIQQELKNRNNRNTQSRHIILRIGLHYGEITLKNDEVYGLGYELASSIEPICEYGGIAVSKDLYEHAHENHELILRGKKNHFFIRPIANFSFKAISNKLTVYKLYLNLLDWYEESQNQVHQYLIKQNIQAEKYDLNFENIQANSNVNHYSKANKFHNQNNLSYSVYHYKMCLDYSSEKTEHDLIELSILHILSKLGLNRMVDKMGSNLSDLLQSNSYFSFIQGITKFNSKSFFESQKYFEESSDDTTTYFFIENCYYLLTIYFKHQDYKKALDLISYHQDFFESDLVNKSRFNLIQLICQFFHNQSNELEELIEKEFSSVANHNNDDTNTLFVYWFLMQFYQKTNNTKKALEIQNTAYSSINQLASNISGLQLKQFFVDKPLLHQMINDEIELTFTSESSSEEFIEPDTSSINTNIFKFCVECGFKNDKNFSFCPSCGGKLTK